MTDIRRASFLLCDLGTLGNEPLSDYFGRFR